MAQKIIEEVNACLKFIYRKKMFLNQYSRKTVCMAMIQCRIDYASNFYYCSLPKFSKNAFRLYKINDQICFQLYKQNTLLANDINEVKWMSAENNTLSSHKPLYSNVLMDRLLFTFSLNILLTSYEIWKAKVDKKSIF